MQHWVRPLLAVMQQCHDVRQHSIIAVVTLPHALAAVLAVAGFACLAAQISDVCSIQIWRSVHDCLMR